MRLCVYNTRRCVVAGIACVRSRGSCSSNSDTIGRGEWARRHVRCCYGARRLRYHFRTIIRGLAASRLVASACVPTSCGSPSVHQSARQLIASFGITHGAMWCVGNMIVRVCVRVRVWMCVCARAHCDCIIAYTNHVMRASLGLCAPARCPIGVETNLPACGPWRATHAMCGGR